MVLVTAPATGYVFFIEAEMTCLSNSRIRYYEGTCPLPLGCKDPVLFPFICRKPALLSTKTYQDGASSTPPSQEPVTEPARASRCLGDILTTHCCSSQEAPAIRSWHDTWILPTTFLCLHSRVGVVFPKISQPSWEKPEGTILLCSIHLPYTKRCFG